MLNNLPAELSLQIAKRLTALRLHKTWTRDELAKRSNVNVHTLKRFERTGQISLPRLVALCEALEILDDFLRAFKPRQRINVEDWQVHHSQERQRGRRHSEEIKEVAES